MHWQDEEPAEAQPFPDDIIDLAFRLHGGSLPVEHAHALSQAISRALPWWKNVGNAGLHLIHGAESGNGWQRPGDDGGEVLHLSRRTRLTLRLPDDRVGDAQALTGATLEVNGHAINVGAAAVKPLQPWGTLFARHVVGEPHEEIIVEQLRQLGIRVRKVMCGRIRHIQMADERVSTRSVLVAGLDAHDAVMLQRKGIGPGRRFGCGLFVPHKSIEPVIRS